MYAWQCSGPKVSDRLVDKGGVEVMSERWLRLSASLVLGAEAIGAILIHEASVSLYIVAPVVIAVIAVTTWLFDSGLKALIKRSDRVARLLGAKLGSGASVHGWWYSKIYRERRGMPRKLIGGSVLKITATIDGFELYGDAYMCHAHEWTSWGGDGSADGDDSIVYVYRGTEANIHDDGFGLYSFFRGNPPKNVSGDFYGRHLPKSRHRTVEGERCPSAVVTASFCNEDPRERRECLLRYLGLSPSGGPSRRTLRSQWHR
jgi:hypothetical protein